MAGDYITTTQIADFAQEFDALSPDGQSLIATSASRFFDNLCKVDAGFFSAATGATAKTFYGDGTAYLKLPPYIGTIAPASVAIVDNDSNVVETPVYFEQNGYLVIKGYGAGVPTRDVSNAGPTFFSNSWPSTWNSYSSPFNTGVATYFKGWPVNLKITVTANWGFAAVPADVQQAVIQLAIHQWRVGDPAFTAISQSGQPYAAPAIPVQVQTIVDNYRETYTSVAGFA